MMTINVKQQCVKYFLYHKHLRFLLAMFANCTCTHKTQQGTVGVLLAGNEI